MEDGSKKVKLNTIKNKIGREMEDIECSDDKLRLNKIRKELGEEVGSIEDEHQQLRTHGRNPRFCRVKQLLKELELLIKGEDCEFQEGNRCTILNDECDIMNKSICAVRLKHKKENQSRKFSYYIKIKQIKKVKNEE